MAINTPIHPNFCVQLEPDPTQEVRQEGCFELVQEDEIPVIFLAEAFFCRPKNRLS